MDIYKRRVIKLVKANPVIWDPTHTDYKNRDVRRNTWNEIDAQVPQILGEKKKAKALWDDLMKGFSNAIRRSYKRGNTNSDKEWKFENDMAFLLPAKKHRISTAGLPEVCFDLNLHDGEIDNGSFRPIELKTEPDQSHDSEDDEDEIRTIHLPQWSDDSSGLQPLQKAQQEMLEEKSAIKRRSTCKFCDCTVKKRQIDEFEESPRLNFFRSLMPSVVSLDDDQFLNLQLEVIQAVQKVKREVCPVVVVEDEK